MNLQILYNHHSKDQRIQRFTIIKIINLFLYNIIFNDLFAEFDKLNKHFLYI